MGKMISLYLTDEEEIELRNLCEESRCTQYSVLKTALKELLCRSVRHAKETGPEEKATEQQNVSKSEAVSKDSALGRC